jgi:hypothetical protein
MPDRPLASVLERRQKPKTRPTTPRRRKSVWHDARHRLGKLSRLTPRDRDAIEALIAARVPKPVPVTRQAAE